MNLIINDTDYELNFGLKFCKEISKDKQQSSHGIDLRIGIENAVTSVENSMTFPQIIKNSVAI